MAQEKYCGVVDLAWDISSFPTAFSRDLKQGSGGWVIGWTCRSIFSFRVDLRTRRDSVSNFGGFL